MTNLLSNAIKYGAGRPIHVRVEADATARRALAVRDQGIGIAPEPLPRIFGRFERAVSERHYGGLGLGLYIDQLVEAWGARCAWRASRGRAPPSRWSCPRRGPHRVSRGGPGRASVALGRLRPTTGLRPSMGACASVW